jgi:outer membrane protein assembly factor BamD
MFKKQLKLFTGISAFLIIALGSCKSKYEKVRTSNDNAKKYTEAVKYYNKKDYTKALGLFDPLVTRYRGQEQAEDLYYYYAYTNYKLRDYTSARYHFKNFADTYPSSTRAEECRFMAAYCYYLDSPIYSLDQENTTNLYPKSDRVPEAAKLIQNLRDKLEEKSYANSKLYLTIGDWQSAVIAFGNTLRDFPDTKYAEEIDYLTIDAQYEYARHSREDRQEERFNQVINDANQFALTYPNSKYLKSAKDYIKDSNVGIVKSKDILAEALTNQRIARKIAKQDTLKSQPTSEKNNGGQKLP